MAKKVVQQKGTSAIKVALGLLLFAGVRKTLTGLRKLAWRWRRVLTPIWVGFGVWLLAVLARWHWTGWAWVVLLLPIAGVVLAVLGPRLQDRVRTVVMKLVPEGLDGGTDGVLDRPVERTYLAVLLTWTGTYLAVRIGDGPSPLSALLWQGAVLGLGGVWWWHRRVRVAGRADKYARRWGRIMRGDTPSMELRALTGSKVVRVVSEGAMARIRVKLAEGITPAQVTRATDSLASYYKLRPAAVFAAADEHSAGHVWFSFLAKDPWKGKIPHPMPKPGSTTLRELGFRFTMGITAAGADVKFKIQHALIVGQSGSGKSVWMESLLIWLLACRDVVIVGIDMASGATLGMFRKVLALPLATDLETATWTLERVLAVIEDRERQLGIAKEQEDSDDDEFQPSPDRPWIVVIVDEYPDLIAAGDKNLIKLIGRIGKRARKCGVRIMPVSQNGSKDDLGSKEFQAQLKAVLSLGLDAHANSVLWSPAQVREGWNSANLRTGQFLLRDEDHTRPEIAKGFYVVPRDRRAIIAEAAQDRPALEPTAWAALTGTDGAIIIDMPAEDPQPSDVILRTLYQEGPMSADRLAQLDGMPSRATVFRRLARFAAEGLAWSDGGEWHYGHKPETGRADESASHTHHARV